jgi:hypothetical protein
MLHHIKKLFGIKPKEEAQAVVESVPYKVPEPAATTPIPLVAEPVVEAPAPADEAKPAKVKKAPAAKKAPAVKKPRAPKTPKAS